MLFPTAALIKLYILTYLLKFAVLRKPCHRNFRKIQGSGESRFGGSKKDRLFLKIPKWKHELARYYKRGKLVSYFLHTAAKTWLYRLKVSENIGHFFQSRTFFRLSSNLHTSCLLPQQELLLFLIWKLQHLTSSCSKVFLKYCFSQIVTRDSLFQKQENFKNLERGKFF